VKFGHGSTIGIVEGCNAMSLSGRLWGLVVTLGSVTLGGATAHANQAVPWQLGFQEAATPVMREVLVFNDLLMSFIVSTFVFVVLLLIYTMIRFSAARNPVPSKTTHNTIVEVVWTVVPIMVLIVFTVPSFKLLYFQDRTVNAEMTIKAIGHQWYWTYEYSDHDGLTFDALIIADDEIVAGQSRLLETDNRLIVPVGTNIRLLTTADDVIHAWGVPAFGIKIDSVPGRVNETWFHVEREGVYYGQCSELCGVYHGFMPITVEVLSKDAFAAWLVKAKEEFAGLGAPATTVADSGS